MEKEKNFLSFCSFSPIGTDWCWKCVCASFAIMPVYTLKHYYVWKSGSHLWQEAVRERQRKRTLNSSKDTRADGKQGLHECRPESFHTQICFYICAMDLSGYTVSASKCKLIKDRIKGPSWFFWVFQIFSASIVVFSFFYFMSHLHNFYPLHS